MTSWILKKLKGVGEIKKFLESNENEYIIYQNLWDTAKTVLKGKFIALSPYLKQ
jgi:hypothetical protein